MDYLLPTFKLISVAFALSAVATGAQAIIDPVGHSKFFGLPSDSTPPGPDGLPKKVQGNTALSNATESSKRARNLAMSYVSLMGARQLGTGTTLLVFAFQRKWTEVATILAIIGVVVAGIDGIYIARGGDTKAGQFHAIPGAMIAALAGAVIYSTA